MFNFTQANIKGLKLIQPRLFTDPRGSFIKTFHKDLFEKENLQLELKEEFFSVSNKGVLRGMHFQTPPHAHNKIVYCVKGSVLDVVVDLRKDSDTYGKSFSIELSEENRLIFYIPTGFAHGFLALKDQTCMVYKTDAVYSPENDTGIHWNSFGFDWPDILMEKLISERDESFLNLSNFKSPF